MKYGTPEHKNQTERNQMTQLATDIATAPIAIGNIFEHSWGYDQTNIDFYEVTAVSKTGRAKIRRIGKQCISTNKNIDVVVPTPGGFIGEETGYKIVRLLDICGGEETYISINKYSAYATRIALDAHQALTSTANQTAWGWGH
jgi:hypothetical protein